MEKPTRLVDGSAVDLLDAQGAALVRGSDEPLPDALKGRVWSGLSGRLERPARRRGRPIAALVAAAALAAIALWVGTRAAPSAGGRMLEMRGVVRTDDGRRLSPDAPVEVPARLHVSRGGSAQVALDRGADIRIEGPAVVRIEANGAEVESGRALHRVTPGRGRFVVRLGEYEVLVRGTQFWTGRTGDAVSVCLLEGRVEIRGQAGFARALSPGDAWRSSDRAPAIPRDLACRLPGPAVAVAPPAPPVAAIVGPFPAAQVAPHTASPAAPLAQAPATASPLAAENELYRLAESRAQGDPRGALDAFMEYRERFPSGALAQEADLSILEMRLRLRSPQARHEAEQFLRQWPASEHAREVHAIRGALLQRAGDCSGALDDFDRALAGRISPARREEALYGRAGCLAAAGRSTDAAAAYRTYLTAHPSGRYAAAAWEGLRNVLGVAPAID